MIHLDRVELLNWDIQQHQMLPFSRGVTIITGENGSGKTSILDAIKMGLGAAHPSAERRVEDYLLHQAKPLVMIRILVDNRRDPSSGRRPFDPLGAYGQDIVTMAVVFRAVDENEYTRDYYLLDGDRVPIAKDSGKTPMKPLGSASEYRERLKKVGIGPRYLKLLMIPQGQVARLCAMSSEALFDYLFDIIGGRTVLEQWEARLSELGERQRAHDAVLSSLKKAEDSLAILARKVDRYRDFEKYKSRAAACEAALPHRMLREATDRCHELETQVGMAKEELLRFRQLHTDALGQAHRASEKIQELTRQEAALKEAVAHARHRHLEHVEQLARQKAALEVLTEIKDAAQGIPKEEKEVLDQAMDSLRAKMATGDVDEQHREAEAHSLEAAMVVVEQGLMPMPEEVERFRQVLRQAGIPHHLLAEVLEVSDERWNEPIEGYLGPLRFAILVQDPEMWKEAALLVRRHRYPYGVLAPDIKGVSPADSESLVSIIEIKEARYRALLARLFRRVVPGEPPSPIEPAPDRRVLIASDGFVLSRTEARHPRADGLYLGRRALEMRRRQILARQAVLQSAALEWQAARKSIREALHDIDLRMERQKRRMAWEAARDRFTDTLEQVAKLDGAVRHMAEARDSLEAKLDACRTEMGQLVSDFKVAEDRARTANAAIERAEKEMLGLSERLQSAEARLSRLKIGDLPPLSEPASALLAESSGEVIESMAAHLKALLEDFREDERDPMLPINHQRQKEESAAVEARLMHLREELGALHDAAERAHEEYILATRRVFRAYFARLKEAAEKIDFFVDGRLTQLDNGRFCCDVKVGVGDKTPVHHDSQQLSGGQKAALSILMGMTAVALEEDGAGFFVIDEPFSNSDLHKINELGRFLEQTGAQYLVSMPTSADLDQCGDWLEATWICTRCRGGVDTRGRPVLAPPLKICFAKGSRRD